MAQQEHTGGTRERGFVRCERPVAYRPVPALVAAAMALVVGAGLLTRAPQARPAGPGARIASLLSGMSASSASAAAGRSEGAAAPALPAVRPELIRHGIRSRKVVALTFDACETAKPAGYDARIIRILRETHTPATLMLGGRWMESHPDATRDLGRDPLFELGSHSYIHPHMTQVSVQRMRVELKKTQDVMYRLTGKQGVLFRPPYGEYNDTVLRVAGEMGLKGLLWEVVTGDPDKHVSAAAIIRTVTSQVRPGSVVIMHVNGRGWHSAEALPTLIQRLRAEGYTFKTVSQMMG